VTSPTTSNYSYDTSTRQGSTGYQNPSTAPSLQGQNPSLTRIAPSGFSAYPNSTGRPVPFNYQPIPIDSTAPPLYDNNTTSSGWAAPSGVPRLYQNQPVQTSNYYQVNYGQNRPTANPGSQSQYKAPYGADTTQSFSSTQSNAPAPMTRSGSQYQSRVQPKSNWSSEQDDIPSRPIVSSGPPQQYGAPLRETTESDYQNENSRSFGQTAPSGYEPNIVTTNRSNFFPGATRGRPQSMYVSYGARQVPEAPSSQTGGTASFGDDSDEEIAREMSKSSLRDPTYRRPVGMLSRSS